MKEEQTSLKNLLRPYLFIAVAGLLAFAPVSFMLRALKNDIIALEYPINQFISQSIHNGEIPYWFNTWGMGFPLQSNLTWGIFSTPQLLFSSLFNYNIYILHIEFMFFVLLAGWGMYYFLQKYILKDRVISQLLAICYMLSGFMVGSTQWLLYITAAAFIPLLLSSLLSLLKQPSLKHSIQFAVVYVLMLTSVYAAFNIITTYSLVIFVALWLLFLEKDKKKRISQIRFLGLSGAMTVVLCLPCLYYTAELLQHIGRGSSIASDASFFNSNYLHPSALSDLLLPFSSVKMNFSNTEGTMLNSYTGLFSLLLLPAAVGLAWKEKNRSVLFILLSAILFLLISFGDMTPLRNALNILPGFSYFRNPAIFRLYFIIALLIFIAAAVRNKNFTELFNSGTIESKRIFYFTTLLFAICLTIMISHGKSISDLLKSDLTTLIKNIDYKTSLFVSAAIQSFFLIAIFLFLKMKKQGLLKLTLALDLVINTVICTPFFSVSSYSIPEVSRILASTNGFPVQTKNPADVPAIYIDERNNRWHNVNIFKKEITSNDSYRGPLTLSNFYSDSSQVKDNPSAGVLFLVTDSLKKTIELTLQRPTHIKAFVNVEQASVITVLQNYYPGWKAYYNNQEVDIIQDNDPGMTIRIPKGSGLVEFRYKRKLLWLSALILHLIVLSFLAWKITGIAKKNFVRSASPS